ILLSVDLPIGAFGFEHVCFAAREAGRYRLRVGPWSAEDSGPYRIRRLAAAVERIQHCEAGLRALAEAEAHRDRASPEVAALYDEAITRWRRVDADFPLAIALKQAGWHSFQRGRLETAVTRFEEALALLRHVSEESIQTTSVLNLAGNARHLAGEPEQARAAFERARTVAQDSGYRLGEAAALSNLALWETSSGDLTTAVELYREALTIHRELGIEAEEATALNGLGAALTQLGRYQQALDALGDALEIRQQQALPEPLASTLAAIGWVEHLSGRGEDAVQHFLRAIELYQEAGTALGEAGALDRLGSAYLELGQEDEAERAFEASLEIYRASTDRVHTAHTATNLGCLKRDAELLAAAEQTFTTLGDRAALGHVRFCQARLERDAGRLDEALARIEQAIALVDQLRAAALRKGYPAPVLALWQEYTELHVEILMRLHERELDASRVARAFEVSDLARARHLYEMLLETRVDVRSGVAEELLERERAVQRRLNAAELRRQSLVPLASGGHDLDPLDKTVRGLLRELADVQAAIRTANPRFAELRHPSPIRLEEIRELLGPETLLLSYVLGAARSYLFVVSHESITSHTLPPRRIIDDLAWRVYQGLRNSQQRRLRAQLPELTRQLSEHLLEPILDDLEERRLLVVGDGLLHYVPFAALPLGGHAPDGAPEVVIDRHEVVHLPSAAVIKTLRQRAAERPAPPKELAVIADAVYTTSDASAPSPGRAASTLPALADLPYTQREAESILALVEPDQRLAALGYAARPELVRGGELNGYRIVHFATHGLVHEQHPQLSGIALSMFDAAGRARDGHLRLHEVYALDLPADLVVLSACRTAVTRQAQGLGLVGLAHGFFYAGASRLLVSVWDVHDEATAELMTAFYRGLLVEGLSPPAALRQAQLWMRGQERWRAAYYWAGFVLEGEWR
ncbi:MAG: CHAT domain-containing tetratricopeptide repeat protein, partial [Acidobacteriota bacterium]